MPTTDEFLAHHGVKGMKWGRRKAEDSSSSPGSSSSKAAADKSPAPTKATKKLTKIQGKIERSDASLQQRAQSVAALEHHVADLRKNGVRSQIFKAQFGDWPEADDSDFTRKFGKSKTQAIADFDNQLSYMRNTEASALNLSAARNKRLKTKAEKLQHDDLNEDDVDELGEIDELDTEAFLTHYGLEIENQDYLAHYDGFDENDVADDILMHYGVKGMRWGHRKAGDSSSEPSARQVKRAEYKSNLKSARAKTNWAGQVKKGQSYTDAEVKALKTNGRRQAAASLALYGAVQVGMWGLGKGLEKSAANRMAAASTAGAQYATRNMQAIGNYPTIRLRQGAGGSWG